MKQKRTDTAHLQTRRVSKVLLVCSDYDSYRLQEDVQQTDHPRHLIDQCLSLRALVHRLAQHLVD